MLEGGGSLAQVRVGKIRVHRFSVAKKEANCLELVYVLCIISRR